MRSELALKTIAFLLSFLRDRKKNKQTTQQQNIKPKEIMCIPFILSICHSHKPYRCHHAPKPGAQRRAEQAALGTFQAALARIKYKKDWKGYKTPA